MNWELVWDIRHTAPDDLFIGLAIAGGTLLVALGAIWHARHAQQKPVLGVFLLVMSLVVAAAVAVTRWDRQRLAARLERGEVRSVEGFVSGHQVWRQARSRSAGETQRYNRWETITVGGVQFTWSLDAGDAAFSNAGDAKIEFRDGLPTRVRWVEDVPGEAHQRRIVALEVAADRPPTGMPPAPFPSTVDPATLESH